MARRCEHCRDPCWSKTPEVFNPTVSSKANDLTIGFDPREKEPVTSRPLPEPLRQPDGNAKNEQNTGNCIPEVDYEGNRSEAHIAHERLHFQGFPNACRRVQITGTQYRKARRP